MIQIGGPAAPGMVAFDAVTAMGGNRERARLAELAEQLQFDDPINIQFTSGTTGAPLQAAIAEAAESACCVASPPCLSGRAVMSPMA